VIPPLKDFGVRRSSMAAVAFGPAQPPRLWWLPRPRKTDRGLGQLLPIGPPDPLHRITLFVSAGGATDVVEPLPLAYDN